MLSFIAILSILKSVSPQCDPADSKLEYFVETFEGKPCYFPFKYGTTTYTDCTGTVLWCASTCNYNVDGQFGKCKWPLSIKSTPECANLPHATQNSLVITEEGKKCVFPFYFEGNCYEDCTPSVSGPWCGVADTDLDTSIPHADRFAYCYYTLAEITQPSCANFPNRAVSSEPEYYPGNNGYNGQCIFPFFYNGECHDDCIFDGFDVWCSIDEVYTRSKKYHFCKYYKNYKTYSAPLAHGFYRISLGNGCPSGPDCGKQIFFDAGMKNVDGKPSIVSHDNPTDGVHDHIFELLPQPDNRIILRTVHDCLSTADNEYHHGISYKSSDWLVSLYDLGENRDFWRLESSGFPNIFKINRDSLGAYWSASKSGEYFIIKLFASTTTLFKFDKLPDNEVPHYTVACEYGKTTPATTTVTTTQSTTEAATAQAPNAIGVPQTDQSNGFHGSGASKGSPTVVDDYQTGVLIALGVIWSVVLVGGIAALILFLSKRNK